MPRFVEIELEFLTPGFVSGADQTVATIPPASVKGQLRWWWRSAAVGRYPDLERFANAESQLFGSAEPHFKSPVDIRVVPRALTTERRGMKLWAGPEYFWSRNGKAGKANILGYLAYGPVGPVEKNEKQGDRAIDPAFNDSNGRAKSGPILKRPAIAAGSTWTLRLAWRSRALEESQVEDLARAVTSWVALGGIGSRSRKGWGALDGAIVRASESDLERRWREVWKAQQADLLQARSLSELGAIPPFPQLSTRAVWLGSPKEWWPDALGEAGLRYRERRRANTDLRWLGGYADKSEDPPRRASSILLTVARVDAKLRGVMALFPCARDKQPLGPRQQEALRAFAKAFGS
jgi:CRISPR type III-B/RAMP module RAMP protein Cmr1